MLALVAAHALLPALGALAAPAQRTCAPSAVSRAYSPATLRRAAATMSTTGVARSGAVLVFDQTDDYFSSRDVFQQLYTHGNYARIACVSASAVRAKKMMLGREARYSGLIDALEIIEAADVTAPAVAEAAGYGIWVILNAEQSKLGAQLAAAKAAGVTRLLVTFSADGVSDAAALEATLAASGLRYTAMRTGELSKQIEGSALRIAALDAPTPAGISRTDAFRVAVEALTIDGAVGKLFALLPADKTQTSAVFREMRFAGVDRRQEVVALLSGTVDSRAIELEAEEAKKREAAEAKAKAMPSDKSLPASSQEEIEAAFARTRARAKFLAEEEAARQAAIEEKRAERMKTQSMIDARIAEVAKAKAGGGGGAREMTDDEDPRGPQKPKAQERGDGDGEGKGDGDDKKPGGGDDGGSSGGPDKKDGGNNDGGGGAGGVATV
ncbi:hypothetical protein KFE25_014206 [Diacronema lutheri]|uniref:Uncharacterized protein n=2 Tax=Diacronema lutheri TaxID=2081491 RepID=A0A8J5X3K6_DIALT|nr:hypothetical protein KFE25_014206 [Diacronema lutheri]